MHFVNIYAVLGSCPNASGGRYSLAEAVNNPVHAEHSEGCAGLRDNTCISRASGGRYLAMPCAVPSSRRMCESAWCHCPSTPALRFVVPGFWPLALLVVASSRRLQQVAFRDAFFDYGGLKGQSRSAHSPTASAAMPWDAEDNRRGTPCKGKSISMVCFLHDEAFAHSGRCPIHILPQGVAALCPGLRAQWPFRPLIVVGQAFPN